MSGRPGRRTSCGALRHRGRRGLRSPRADPLAVIGAAPATSAVRSPQAVPWPELLSGDAPSSPERHAWADRSTRL